MAIVPFAELVKAHRSKATRNAAATSTGVPEYPILAIDPGQTSGVAAFSECCLQWCTQIKTYEVRASVGALLNLIAMAKPKTIIVEDYRVYKWRMKQHVGSSLVTPRVIGAIEAISGLCGIPLVKQPPQVAKAFCSDEKLKSWGYYVTGKPHARDAIRHGCYFLLFAASLEPPSQEGVPVLSISEISSDEGVKEGSNQP